MTCCLPPCLFRDFIRLSFLLLDPPAEIAADFVQAIRGIAELTGVDELQPHAHGQQAAEFFETEVGALQPLQLFFALVFAVIGVGEVFQNIEQDLHGAVAEEEFMIAREIFNVRREPDDEIFGAGEKVVFLGHQIKVKEKCHSAGILFVLKHRAELKQDSCGMTFWL